MKLIFMGSKALADGFALLGFEIFPDASSEMLENELAKILKEKERALIFVENDLTQQPGPFFLRARSKSAEIIITEIPPLKSPNTYHPSVENLVVRVLGASVLDKLT